MLIIPSSWLFAQNDTSAVPDSVKADSIRTSDSQDQKGSEQGLKAKVDYSAEDSMIYDRKAGTVLLYGNAKVSYKKIRLEAARIRFSFEKRTVLAYGVEDSTGKMVGQPVMKEGDKKFDARRIRYNFKTKKGVIKEVHTQEGKGDLYSRRTKKHPDGEIHVKKGKYTTCSLSEYYIRFNKAVVIPNDKIVSGPANLVIGGIPTPLFLPFGYYPQEKGGESGIVLPKPGESQRLGFYLSEGGYYWRFDPHLDTRVTGKIYSKGSWGINNFTRYKNRYRYSGNLRISYSRIVKGDQKLPGFEESREFFIRWKHRQDPKARPNSSFNANVNVGSEDNFRNTLNSTPQDYVSNSFNSNIDYSKNWPNTPFSFNASLRHSQNSRSGDIQFSLPDLGFNVNRFYPLRGIGKEGTAERKWYEKIGVNYVGNLRNQIRTQSERLSLDRLTPLLNEQMRYGMKHRMNATTSLKPGVFSVTPNIGISDRWYLETIEERYDTSSDEVDTNTVHGFRNAPQGHASLDLTTKLYGMYQFLGKRKITIRHVLTPNVGFTYRPSSFDLPQRGPNGTNYNPYRRTIFGGPTSNESGKIRLALINNIEGKYKALNDSSTESKKFKIIDNLSIRSSYDMMADSLNWRPVSLSARTTLFEKFGVRFQSSFDPYAVNPAGFRVDRSQWKAEGQLLRWERSTLNVSGDLKSKRRDQQGGKDGSKKTMAYIRKNPQAYVDFKIPWNLGFTYTLRANRVYEEGAPPVELDRTINLNGNFRITENWKVEFRSGYDPEAGQLTHTRINIYRNLDCWEMSFNWVPFGRRRRYSFQINLAAPFLKDLKLQKRQQWYDRDVKLE
ncbi:MAG: putative LPS assembly protein LptD [Flavobacteriales bacterium]